MTKLAAGLLLAAIMCHGKEIFVSPEGSDKGKGTAASPYATVQKALEAAGGGNAVITLRGGTYHVTSRLRINVPNVTLRSYPGEWAHISAPIDNPKIVQAVEFWVGSSGGRLERLEISGGHLYAVMIQGGAGWSRDPATDIVIQDCDLHGSGRDVIKLTPGTDRVTIRRNRIHDSGRRDASNAEGIDNVNADDMLVQDNRIYNIATSGLYAKGGAKRPVIERNLIMNTGGAGIALGFTTDAEFFDPDNRERFESIGAVVRNNIIVNTDWAGIGMFAAKSAQVYNNTLIDTGRVYHGSISIQPAANPFLSRTASEDITIRNNIVAQGNGGRNPLVHIRCHTGVRPCAAGLLGMPSMSNNLYFVASGQARFADERPDHRYSGGLAGWRKHIDGETGSIEADPRLDAAYHLLEDSPAIGAGAALADDDCDGQSRTGPNDIGADQHGINGAAPPRRSPTAHARTRRAPPSP